MATRIMKAVFLLEVKFTGNPVDRNLTKQIARNQVILEKMTKIGIDKESLPEIDTIIETEEVFPRGNVS
eukprot:TRINITY_DN3409_c0_g1_i1.p2 TRINITY_DN3409_c0_g1~~TRINITY_DN3409_c0_g1_i1.p2  ORF type:complete len:69 (+),score=15.18 TRINITY_DN3409_c0_g1_i1:1017-1223(+)